MFAVVYRTPLWIVFSSFVVIYLLWAYIEDKYSASKKWKLIKFLILLSSIYFILDFTLLNRGSDQRVIWLQPFRQITLYKDNPEIFRSIIMNIALFFPFGLALSSLLYKRIKKQYALITSGFTAFCVSLVVELLQYYFYLGEAETDDVIFNTFGGMIGASVLLLLNNFDRIKTIVIKNADICKYLLCTFGISWGAWAFLSYFSYHGPFYFKHPISIALHIIGGFGPTIAYFLVNQKSITLKRMLCDGFKLSKRSLFYIFIFAILEVIVFVIALSINKDISPVLSLLILLQATFIYGGNEEFGWRGFLQPKLEQKYSFYISSILTGVIWCAWHIPLWFVDGSSQENFPFLAYSVIALVLSFLLGALYSKTKSIIACSIIHGLTNTLLSVFVFKMNVFFILGLFAMLVFSIFIYKKTER